MKISLDNYTEGFGSELTCPNCKNNNLHQERIEVFDREEDADTGIHTTVDKGKVLVDNDLTGNPSRRRQGLSIFFRCEHCDAMPKLSVYQHKGCTFAAISTED